MKNVKYYRPHLVIYNFEINDENIQTVTSDIFDFIVNNKISVLNVAGNRLSSIGQNKCDIVEKILIDVFDKCKVA